MTCTRCAKEVAQDTRFCPQCGATVGSTTSFATVAMAAPATSSSTFDEGRFPPGTLLADRYRVVALLGKGGMGEVYRANDLKLAQPVAMKFLPSNDLRMIERFRSEVRIARQVSHPNVCRVYDIGEAEGQAFLTMEYVDGEDLASLLRRIGRLTNDKALEIARKLCAGLAAAHDKGVLHRDLKPANVMIDGRGQVLITDFGLAGLIGQVQDITSGTPAYMAPEQRAGREVSVRSDIYSLALVLREIFPETELDPAVDRVIRRCLEDDPRLRPATAISVAMQLPGGDPLAAALAAGETPSPELVAAAGKGEGLSMRAAWICLAVILAGVITAAAIGGPTQWLDRAPMEYPGEALAAKARDLIEHVGYREPPQDRAWGWGLSGGLVQYALRHQQIKQLPVAPFFVWYRQSPLYLAPYGANGRVTTGDPPMTQPGMLRVVLSSSGKLLDFRAVPAQRDSSPANATPPDWSPLLFAAGIDLQHFHETGPEWLPLAASDARVAWAGSFADSPGVPIRVEAAAWRGRPIYFQVIGPWTVPAATAPTRQTIRELISRWIPILIISAIFVTATWLAWRHAKSGRGDLRGATRLGLFAFGGTLGAWFLTAQHAPTAAEYARTQWGISSALFTAGAYWVLYVALEPYVRRRWPQSLVSWTRLLAGAARDPLVGAHVLVGVVLGVGVTLLFYTQAALQQPTQDFVTTSLLGPLPRTGALLDMAVHSIGVAMGLFFLYFIFRQALRKPWLSATVYTLFFATVAGISYDAPLIPILVNAITALVSILVLTRFGLLPLIVGILVSTILPGFPMTLDFSTWYSGSTMMAIGAILALAGFAFNVTRTGRTA